MPDCCDGLIPEISHECLGLLPVVLESVEGEDGPWETEDGE